MARTLEGQRIVVVGASAGIGREFALRAIRDGGKVVLGARRTDRLGALTAEAGGGVPLPLDIAEPQSCAAFAEQAQANLGSVDLVVCTAGYSHLRWFGEATGEDWRRILDINVIGIHQLIRALLPVCTPGAIIAVLSSESVMQPRQTLGVYTASKAALEQSIRAWRLEQPSVRFTTFVVGGTFPTDFGADFDPERLLPAMESWARHGTIQEKLMSPEQVADAMIGTLSSVVDIPDVSLDYVVVRSPSPVAGGSEHLAADATDNISRLNESPSS